LILIFQYTSFLLGIYNANYSCKKSPIILSVWNIELYSTLNFCYARGVQQFLQYSIVACYSNKRPVYSMPYCTCTCKCARALLHVRGHVGTERSFISLQLTHTAAWIALNKINLNSAELPFFERSPLPNSSGQRGLFLKRMI
jgi:hypothetical protein